MTAWKLRLDPEPTIWLIHGVKAIGIFEAKTHLTAICSEIVRTGQPVLVQRRGKPLVLISAPPVELVNPLPDIHTAWAAWEREHGSAEGDDADFPEVGEMRQDQLRNPLAEEG
jgi:antitoxin (DNA-binding transcriptional repressor) of toxin-antitoxin stability system